MGEIADMIVDGTMCPCGEFTDGGAEGPGFTQYCSDQCRNDYGGAQSDDRLDNGPMHRELIRQKSRTIPCDWLPSVPHGPCGRKFKTPEAMEQHKKDKHG